MTKLQLAAGLAVAAFTFAAMPQARADVYDYGYGPVYGGYPAVSGSTCPNGQCSGSCYSPAYSTTYPVYSAQTCPNGSCGLSGTCPSGTCGTCPNGSCGLRGQCSGGQCSSGQCANGSCRNGRCGTCPSGDCERGNCSGNCPNGQCTTRYRGSVDPLSRPSSPSYDRPDYGAPDDASYRPNYSSERPVYRDYRDEPVSRRSWRSEPRPTSRDSDLESPFYN
jgi:hypothetical protein